MFSGAEPLPPAPPAAPSPPGGGGAVGGAPVGVVGSAKTGFLRGRVGPGRARRGGPFARCFPAFYGSRNGPRAPRRLPPRGDQFSARPVEPRGRMGRVARRRFGRAWTVPED